MKNRNHPMDPQGDACRLLMHCAGSLLVVQHPDHCSILSLEDNGATWSDNPERLWDLHRETAASHAAGIAASDLAAAEIRAATGHLRRARTQRGFQRMAGAAGAAFRNLKDSGDLPRELTVCRAKDLDRDPHYLGCANGVVNLNTGRIMPPEEGRRQLVSRNTGVVFDPEARDSFVDSLLASLHEPERRHLMAALGHALQGGSPGRWYVLAGAPSSGKNALLRTIAGALGVIQSRGYTLQLADRTMISGRHTGTARFADQLRDFGRGRIALGGGLSRDAARLNRTLIRSLTSRDLLPNWTQIGRDGTPPPVTATIFQAMLPEDIDRLNLRDTDLVDRTHVLHYPPGHGVGGSQGAPTTGQARQAMLALLVQHARENPEPPDAPEPVTGLLRERRRASIGSVGRWIVDHLQVTGDGDETVLADEIITALAKDIPPDDQGRYQGRSRREILALARDLVDQFPAAHRVKRGGRLQSEYPGLRLLTTAGDATQAARSVELPDPESIRRTVLARIATRQGCHDPEGSALNQEETLDAAPELMETVRTVLAESSIMEKVLEMLEQEREQLALTVLSRTPQEHREALEQSCRDRLPGPDSTPAQ